MRHAAPSRRDLTGPRTIHVVLKPKCIAEGCRDEADVIADAWAIDGSAHESWPLCERHWNLWEHRSLSDASPLLGVSLTR